MLELLDAAEHALRQLLSPADPGLGRLLGDRRPTRELGDEHVAGVADLRRVDVLEGAGVGLDPGGVQAGLVREGVLADVGLGRVRRAVEQLVDEVGGLGQAREPLRREHLDAHLQLQVGDDRDEVGVPGALADAVDRPLHLGRARFERGQRVRDRTAGVVVAVDPQRRPRQRFAHDRERGADLGRQRAAVGVAQDEPLRPGVGAPPAGSRSA